MLNIGNRHFAVTEQRGDRRVQAAVRRELLGQGPELRESSSLADGDILREVGTELKALSAVLKGQARAESNGQMEEHVNT
eukprot:9439881-Pyramimonas_sp.AAC.1